MFAVVVLAAVDYKDPNFVEQLEEACPDGVDVYFDNVGGSVSNCVLRLMNQGGRVPICGQIASYDEDVAYTTLCSDEGIDVDARRIVHERSVRRERFTVINYPQVRTYCTCALPWLFVLFLFG